MGEEEEASEGASEGASDSEGACRRRDTVCAVFWPLLAVVAVLLTVGSFVTAIVNGRKDVYAAIAMAPAGAMLRYLLSLGNKRWCLQIPWFTFAGNMLGCSADAIMVWQLTRT